MDPENADDFMEEMQRLALSLKMPWPIPEDDEEQAASNMTKLQIALFSREIEKALVAGRK